MTDYYYPNSNDAMTLRAPGVRGPNDWVSADVYDALLGQLNTLEAQATGTVQTQLQSIENE